MSYNRVIPRDLFNEGNLLKCYRRVYINLEKMGLESFLKHEHSDNGFDVWQNPADGSLSIQNIYIEVRGNKYDFMRPLNSRDSWPLYLLTHDGEELEVFRESGEFTVKFIAFIGTERGV